jgi:hypothetical protein
VPTAVLIKDAAAVITSKGLGMPNSSGFLPRIRLLKQVILSLPRLSIEHLIEGSVLGCQMLPSRLSTKYQNPFYLPPRAALTLVASLQLLTSSRNFKKVRNGAVYDSCRDPREMTYKKSRKLNILVTLSL